MLSEGSLRHWDTDRQHRRIIAIQWGIAILTAIAGVLGLVRHSWLRRLLESWINIHALFGVLLLSFIIAGFYLRGKHSSPMLPPEVREFSRQLSRMVYLILYAVIGIRLIIGLLNSPWQGGIFDFNPMNTELQAGPDRETFDPKDDFQALLFYGLVALAVIRVSAYAMWLRLSD